MFAMNPGEVLNVLFSMKAEPIETFVETGLRRGGTFAPVVLAGLFRQAIGIEIDAASVDDVRDRLRIYADRFDLQSLTSVEFRVGDSAELLPALAAELDESAFFHLDAHQDHDSGNKPTPLMRELEAIRGRKFSDVIAIDDVRLFGRGPVWRHVSRERILELFPRAKFWNKDRDLGLDRMYFRTR